MSRKSVKTDAKRKAKYQAQFAITATNKARKIAKEQAKKRV